jgi:hypothetical protein
MLTCAVLWRFTLLCLRLWVISTLHGLLFFIVGYFDLACLPLHDCRYVEFRYFRSSSFKECNQSSTCRVLTYRVVNFAGSQEIWGLATETSTFPVSSEETRGRRRFTFTWYQWAPSSLSSFDLSIMESTFIRVAAPELCSVYWNSRQEKSSRVEVSPHSFRNFVQAEPTIRI